LEESRIIRPGYAIEYDFVDPRELRPDLQSTRLGGLFHAGQINGTTGYEEAACQGLIAGINAARFVKGQGAFRLRREESYIGVLLDDLITQGVDEPYRIFTSRAENRLALRHDNADVRLGSYGREIGLVGDQEWERFNTRLNGLGKLQAALELRLKRSMPAYGSVSSTLGIDLGDSITLAQLAQRPQASFDLIRSLIETETGTTVARKDLETALADSLYSGYIAAQHSTTQRLHQHDGLRIPPSMNFAEISGLSHEMVERLERGCPLTFGQARCIPGMTPASLSTLLVHLTLKQKAA
jgi:tRNA uridine 5-carboxymethylaminomethyl modification enzyme